MSVWLIEMGMASNYASTVSTAVVVVVITYVSIVVGELVPKRLGQTNPESIARLVARPINLLAKLTKPFVLLLTSSTRGLLRILGVRESNESVGDGRRNSCGAGRGHHFGCHRAKRAHHDSQPVPPGRSPDLLADGAALGCGRAWT